MGKFFRRTPRNYDGTATTTHKVTDLLPFVLEKIDDAYQQQAALLLANWPSIIGPKLAPLTQAVSFDEGILLVKVKNSTIYSLLNQYDKPRILEALRTKFPRTIIRNIHFRMA